MTIERQIAELLHPLDLDALFVFGSRSRSGGTPDSDIDLAVVLPVDEMPKGIAQKMANVRRARALLAELNKRYAIDLLVFTRPEWEEFKKRRPLFAAEIVEKGRRTA